MSLYNNIEQIANIIDDLKKKINENIPTNLIIKEMSLLFNKISNLQPFNNYLFDIYSETKEIELAGNFTLDLNKKAIILMKLDFWKTKINNSIDIIDV